MKSVLYTHRRLGFVLIDFGCDCFYFSSSTKIEGPGFLAVPLWVSFYVFCPGSSPSDSNVAQWFPFSLLESLHHLPPAAPWSSKGKKCQLQSLLAFLWSYSDSFLIHQLRSTFRIVFFYLFCFTIVLFNIFSC